MKTIVILGAGATALEIGEMLVEQRQQGAAAMVLGFLDDDPQAAGLPELGLRVLGPLADVRRFSDACFVLGIAGSGTSGLRQNLVRQLDIPTERYITVVHSSAQISALASVGSGCVLMHNAIVNRGVRLAEHVLVTQGVFLGHDSTVGAFSVLAPNATLCGRTFVGESVYVGAGAIVSSEVKVGNGAVIGIGSTVLDNVAPESTVFNNSARPIADGEPASWMEISAAASSDLRANITRLVADLAADTGALDSAPADSPWDSLLRVQLAVALEQEFAVKLTAADVETLNSIDAALRLVRRGESTAAAAADRPEFQFHHRGVAVRNIDTALTWCQGTFGGPCVAGPGIDPHHESRRPTTTLHEKDSEMESGKNMSSIYAELTEIFRDIFDDDNLQVTPELTAADVDEWDSLNHIRLVLSVERAFSLTFSAAQVSRLKNVGEFAELIGSKL